MKFYNGHFESKELFNNNYSIKAIDLEFSDGTYLSVPYLSQDFIEKEIDFGHTIYASWVKIIIKEVYPTQKHTDTCISEIKFY